MSENTPFDADAYFAVVPEWVVYCGDPRAVQLYAILARHANHDGVCWPGRRRLAEKAECSTDTVDRAVKLLEKIGAIEVTREKDEHGQWKVNRYKLYTSAPMQRGSRTDAATPSRASADRVVAPVPTQLKPENESQVEPSAPAAQVADRDGYWDQLEAVFGYRPIGAETALWGRIIKLVRETGDQPEEISRRAALWMVGPVWADRQAPPRLTPGAFFKHYQWLGSRMASATPQELESWRAEYKKADIVSNIEGDKP